jgi:tetratricopeptide (TPR) repeat protein
LSHFSLGLLAESNGDAATALSHLHEAIRIDPNEPALYPPAIAIAMQLEQGDEALRLCRQFRKRQPESLPPRLLEAQVCMLTSRDEEAEQLFRQAVAAFPDHPDSLLGLARFLIAHDRNPEAVDLLEPALEKPPVSPDIYHMLGTLAIGRARTIREQSEAQSAVLEGIALIELSMDASADDPQKWLQLGYAYLAAGKAGEAKDAFERAYAIYPDDILIARPLLDLCIQRGDIPRVLELCEEIPKNTRTEPELWFQYLGERLPKEHREQLADELQTYLKKNPRAPILYYARLSSLYIDMDRIPEAEAVLQAAIIRFPGNSLLGTAAAHLCLQQERYEEAYSAFCKVRSDTPASEWIASPFFTFNLMVSALKSGRLAEAAEALAEAYAESPDILTQTMQALLAEEAPLSRESAIELLRAFRTLTPNAGETLYYMALLQAASQEYDTALDNARLFEASASGTQTNLLDAFFYYQYAVLHERTGLLSDAETYFRRAIELGNPATAASAQNYIAYMWAERGERLELGLAMVQMALEAEPDNAAYLDTLGWIYYMQGRYREALETLKKAVSQLGSDPVIQEHLGDTYLKLGDRSTAVKHWKKALEILPDEERLIRRLEEHSISPDESPAPADSPADTPRRP